MIVRVRLFAMLRDKLPPGTKSHELEMKIDMPEGTTPHDVIQHLDIPAQLAHLVMIDGTHLLPDERMTRVIQEGEVLAIVPPVSGGT